MVTPRTVLDYIQLATKHLENSGVETPRLDAEVLLGNVLDLERIHLYVQYDRPLISKEVEAYRSHIARRARREPIAYIVGKKEFLSLDLKVDSRVLIPRPETELLVQEVMKQLVAAFGEEERYRIADVGTGSGAIVIGLAKEMSGLSAVATDLDADALAVARENIAIHDLTDRIECRQGDLLQPLVGARFHAIVSNPPYVSTGDWSDLQPDVRDYEPKKALVGGSDGLDLVRKLMATAPQMLVGGGFLALEIGADQGNAVLAHAKELGYTDCRIVKDLAQRDRIAVMTREGAVS